MSFLTGGSQQSSQSGNQSYDYLKQLLGGEIGNGANASNGLAGMLGLNGGADQTAALHNLWNGSGMQSMLNSGENAITGNAAAGGMLQSGATGKAMEGYRSNLAQQNTNNFMNQMQGLMSGGNQAAGTLAGAGQYSNGSGSSSPGMGGILGGLLGAL